MTEDNQPKPPSWEEGIFESIDFGTEENKYVRWVYTPSNSSLPPTPAPEITPASLLYSLQAFDAIVQKVVEINAGRWIFPEDAPILVRAVLKAIVEVNNGSERRTTETSLQKEP